MSENYQFVELNLQIINSNINQQQENIQSTQSKLSITQCIQLADELRSYGYLDLSLQLYQDLILLFPNDYFIIARKAVTLLKAQNYKQSINCMQKAIQLTKNKQDKLDCLLIKADVYYSSKKYNKAIRLYQQVLQKTPNLDRRKQAQIYYRKGLCFMAKNLHKKAIQQFQSAIIRNYNYAQAHMMKGNCLFLLKQFQKAIRHFNYAVINGLNQNIDLLTIKGLSHYNIKQYQKAKICFQNAIDIDQKNSSQLKIYLTLIKLNQSQLKQDKKLKQIQ